MNFRNVNDDPVLKSLIKSQSKKAITIPQTIRTRTLINICWFIIVSSFVIGLFIYILIIRNQIQTLEIENQNTQETYTLKIKDLSRIKTNFEFNRSYLIEANNKNNKWTDDIKQTKTAIEASRRMIDDYEETCSNLKEESKILTAKLNSIQASTRNIEEDMNILQHENDSRINIVSNVRRLFNWYKQDYLNLAGQEYKEVNNESSKQFSTIINDKDKTLLENWIARDSPSDFVWLYRGSIDGFNSKSFQSALKERIDNKFLVLIKTSWPEGDIIGGCFFKSFIMNIFTYDNAAFIFNWSNKKVYPVNYHEKAVFLGEGVLISFGGGDITIYGREGHSNFPQSYGKGSSELEWTNGQIKFKIEELEVFEIINDLPE